LSWNGLVPAAELVLRFEALMSRVSLI
jgi:hypothetical protein